MQTAEDARIVALRRQEEEFQAQERAAAARREADALARARAEEAARERAERGTPDMKAWSEHFHKEAAGEVERLEQEVA